MYLIKSKIPDFIILILILLSTYLIFNGRFLYSSIIVIITAVYMMYTIGKRRPIRRVNGEVIKDEKIKKWNKELSEEIGIKEPTIMKGYIGSLNAFAVGRKNAGTIVLSENLIKHLEDEEIKAVLLHEMSHLYSHDTIITTVNNILGFVIDYIALQLRKSMLTYPFYLVLSKIVYNIIELPFLYISRKREIKADRDSARINSKEPILRALIKIGHVNRNIEKDNVDRTTKQICILGINEKITKSNIFSTHPPLEKRIKEIRNLNK